MVYCTQLINCVSFREENLILTIKVEHAKELKMSKIVYAFYKEPRKCTMLEYVQNKDMPLVLINDGVKGEVVVMLFVENLVVVALHKGCHGGVGCGSGDGVSVRRICRSRTRF